MYYAVQGHDHEGSSGKIDHWSAWLAPLSRADPAWRPITDPHTEPKTQHCTVSNRGGQQLTRGLFMDPILSSGHQGRPEDRRFPAYGLACTYSPPTPARAIRPYGAQPRSLLIIDSRKEAGPEVQYTLQRWTANLTRHDICQEIYTTSVFGAKILHKKCVNRDEGKFTTN